MSLAFTKICRDTVLGRLSDEVLGLNAKIAANATEYGQEPFTIDFTGESGNFYQVNADPDTIEASSEIYGDNYAVLYTAGASDTGNIKSMTFSGNVNVILRIHHLFSSGRLEVDMESIMDLVDSCVLESVNDPQNYMVASHPKATYQGGVQLSRLPLTTGKKNYLRLGSVYVFPFFVDN